MKSFQITYGVFILKRRNILTDPLGTQKLLEVLAILEDFSILFMALWG
jgi:hypothetical protein